MELIDTNLFNHVFIDNLGAGEEQVRWATKIGVGEATGAGGARKDKATEKDGAYS